MNLLAIAFVLPRIIHAASGLECNIYYEASLDSVRPDLYAYEVESKVGVNESGRWTWTPQAGDAGRSEQLIVRAWSDFGSVATATVTVQVAKMPHDLSRRVTCALLSDSSTSSLYQNRIYDDMLAAGWKNFTPIGSHSGGSSSIGYAEGGAKHDGYGGFTPSDFLTRYLEDVNDINSINDAAEREQLLKFGYKIPAGQPWRKGLLKSPLIRIEKGQKVVDVQMWLNKVNDGQPPDYILVQLGVNGTCGTSAEGLANGYCEREQVRPMLNLIAKLRERAPNAIIGIGLTYTGAASQDAFGKNYGCSISRVQGRRNVFALNRCWMKMVDDLNAAGDKKVCVVSVGPSIDWVNGAITEEKPPFAHALTKQTRSANAYHPTREGGKQMGDAFAAWLLCHLAR